MSVGWFGPLAQRRISQRPDTVPMEVWLSPAPCTWDYISEGPYRIMRGTTHRNWGIEYNGWEEDLRDEGDALLAFSRRHLPRPGEWCMLADAHNQIVLGWTDEQGHLEWVGCQFVFNLLATVHNPIDAAVWEQAAKDRTVRFNPLEVRP